MTAPTKFNRDSFDASAFFAAVHGAMAYRKVNAKQLSEATGISESTLSRMWFGTRVCDAASLAALSAWAGINPANYCGAAPTQPVTAEPTQVGWIDERGILFPLSSYNPDRASQYDAHKAGWEPVYKRAAPAAADISRKDWQKRAIEVGFEYWRASDAHGVECTSAQAIELLQDVLGVEVEIKDAAPPKCATCDDHGIIGGPSYYNPGEGGEPCPDCAPVAPLPPAALAEARAFGAGLDADSIEQPSEVV